MNKSSTAGSLFTGAAIGAALATAVTMILHSRTGQEMTEELKKKMSDFYDEVIPDLKKLKNVSEKEFRAFMKKAATHYSKAKDFTADESKALLEDAENSWTHIKGSLE